jgi:murein DD-endopeptidase MepM/ murein hydrolase activator NlpD
VRRLALAAIVLFSTGAAQLPTPLRSTLHQTIDLDVREPASVRLSDGHRISIQVIDLHEQRDSLRSALREARATVDVDGERVELICGNYRLPVRTRTAQIDCPATHGLLENSTEDAWGLNRSVRLRVWPLGSPWIQPDSFAYPLRQKWFASGSQMSNEPVFVDGGEVPANKKIYYHAGLDIGGAEGLVDVVAATSGLVVSAGTARLPGYENSPIAPRDDVVYLLDDRGWYYRYSHMKAIDGAITPGARVRMRHQIGVLGKEGASGGWSHLHFEIKSRQPSGKWGTEDGYAFLWQAYLDEFMPDVIAVARPHHLATVGEPVTLDASRSWSSAGGPLKFTWWLKTALDTDQPRPTVRYDRPGSYSETLKVTDAAGHQAYDFAVVQVIDPAKPDQLPPTMQASYAPTFGIKPRTAVTFKVRTFRTTDGEETWDFGDGSAPVTVKSDGTREHDPNGFAVTEHRFQKPGDFIVSVSRANAAGIRAWAKLWVHVDQYGGRSRRSE